MKKQPGFKAGLKKVETKGGYVYYYKVKINGVLTASVREWPVDGR